MSGRNKKEAYGGFLKPNAISPYSDNLRSIFIDKNEDDLKSEPENFLESSLTKEEIVTANVVSSSEQSKNESEDKVGTNRVQSGDKTEQKLGTKEVQTGYKGSLAKDQVGTNEVQIEFKSGDISRYKLGTNRGQSESKLGTKTLFSELTGLQREIVIFFCQECKKTRTKVTEPLTIEYLTSCLKRTYDAIKTSIKRLEKKGCIIRVKFKNGRGGWSQYEIPGELYHDAIQHETGYKSDTNRVQTGYKVGSELGTETGTNASSSSSTLILKGTTTELNDEWNFDITPYYRFGFTISQLKQLVPLGVISAADVEQSLIEFSYDLDNNALPPIKTNKINFLMGLLRSGHSYVSEGFKNEQDAMIAEMARRAAEKRESLLKAKFEAWEAALDDMQRKEIENKLPTHLMVSYRAHGIGNGDVKKWLFEYFIKM